MKLLVISILITFLPIKIWANDTIKLEKKYRFEKGSHFSKPRNLFSRSIELPDTLRWSCRFDKSCCYYINDENGKIQEDQWDYNKLTGITFSPLNPLNNTAMIGWRHNPQTLLFELIPYWHVSKKRFFKDNPFLTVQPDEDFIVEFIADKIKKEVTIIIKTKNKTLKETKSFEKIPDSASLIHPYFGGTSRAPCVMELYIKRLK